MKTLLTALLALLLAPAASAQFTPRVMTATPSSARVNPGALRIQQDVAEITRMYHTGRQVMTVSGNTGQWTEDLVVPSGAWVSGVQFGERADKPCHIRLTYATIENGEIEYGNTSWSPCSETRRSLKRASTSAGIPDVQSQGTAFIGALDGVAVCTRNSNNRLKGVRLGAAGLVDFSGTTVGVNGGLGSGNLEDEQQNCNDWDAMVACPAEKVLVGVQLHKDTFSRRGYTEEYMVGLSPICAGLRIGR